MIRSLDLGQDVGIPYIAAQPVGYNEIVYAPAHVPFSRGSSVAPPGIRVTPVGIEEAEAVGKSGFEKLSELAALLIRKTGIAYIGLGVLQIYFIMGNIHISTGYDRLFRIESAKIVSELILPVHPVVYTFQPVLSIRRIYAYEEEFIIFKRNSSAFSIVAVDADVMPHGQGFVLCEYSCA